MPPLTKAQQSKVGRRSRRKGKKLECMVAAWLRVNTRWEWETTRNSGRTDLKGDVYCLSHHDVNTHVVIECKHRQSWTTADVVKGNKTYTREFEDVVNKWHETAAQLLIFFRKDSFGLWVAIVKRHHGKEENPEKCQSITSRILGETQVFVRGPDGFTWCLVDEVLHINDDHRFRVCIRQRPQP